ncbi:hypothetical protein [Halocatena halophila]|uniref:hypothetical protein n=1 Tax=Halocatena halophila TaxID=2814576 RepID=UPI002ED2EACD
MTVSSSGDRHCTNCGGERHLRYVELTEHGGGQQLICLACLPSFDDARIVGEEVSDEHVDWRRIAGHWVLMGGSLDRWIISDIRMEIRQ